MFNTETVGRNKKFLPTVQAMSRVTGSDAKTGIQICGSALEVIS